MDDTKRATELAAATILTTVPRVWDRIRANLRSAGTGKLGITLEQFHVLRHIRLGYASVGEIASVKQISKSAASQSVDALEAKGLVERRQDGADRRCVTLALTPYAEAVMDENLGETREWMASRMAGISPGDLSVLSRAMEILAATFAAGPDVASGRAER